jgi:hypothetical protein
LQAGDAVRPLSAHAKYPVAASLCAVFSEALGRPIRYRDVPLPAWSEGLHQARYPEYVVRHLSAVADMTRQGRYDRMTDTYYKLTGEAPTSMRDFVKLHAADFKQLGAAHS